MTRVADISLAVAQPVSRPSNRWARVWQVLAFAFVAAAVLAEVFKRDDPRVHTLSVTFISIVLEALPFVMLGALVGGLIEVFLSRDWVTKMLPRSSGLAVLVAAGMGVIFPVCECAVVPVTRRLLGKGVPFSAAVAYLLAGPIFNPLVAGSTAVAYAWDWRIVATRMICGYAIGALVGFLMGKFYPGTSALLEGQAGAASSGHEVSDNASCGCGHDHGHVHAEGDHHEHAHENEGSHHHDHAAAGLKRPTLLARLTDALNHGADDFLFVTQFLIVGAFVAALSQTFVNREAFVALGRTPALSVLLMMCMAVILTLCSEADAFVAASFRNTLPLSAQMAFMVLGPMLDLKLTAMYLSFFRKRAFLTLVALMGVFVFVAMMIVQLLLKGPV